MNKIIFHIKRIYCLIKYGKIDLIVMDNINYTSSEIKYVDRNGKTMGYWAYGYYEPYLPYQGQSYFTFKSYYH
jgi:hypothetical protein